MADVPLELELRRLEEAARLAHARIEQALVTRSYIDRIAYSRTSRIKARPRMASKVQQLRSTDNADFQPSMLPDVLGFRIITYFQAGILEVLDILLALAQHDLRAGESPFVKDDIRRITLHSSRPDGDPLSLTRRVDALAKGRGLSVERSSRESLYSSVHVVLCVHVETDAFDVGKILVPLQVEFQLRSVFEEAWGQLSHLLSYGRSRAIVDQKTWQLHLGVLKALIDGCIQYAELIKEQSGIDMREAEAETERTRSAASPNEILADLPPLTAAIRGEFENAFALEDQAQKLGDDPRAGSKFAEAARAFQQVQASLARDEYISKDTIERATYIAQTEGTYCRLFSNEENAILEAIESYERITQKHSADAVSRYRYGQALRRAQFYDKAIKMLQESIALLSDNEIHKDHWVRSSAYRELGYVYWLTIETGADISLKKGKLHEAIVNTRLALAVGNDPEENIRSTNNFIYYGWEERNFEVEAHEYEISDGELRDLLRTLLKAAAEGSPVVGRFPGLELWSALDTAGRALDYLGEAGEAEQAARKVISLLVEKLRRRITIPLSKRPSTKEIQHNLTADEFDAYIYATTLVGGGPREP